MRITIQQLGLIGGFLCIILVIAAGAVFQFKLSVPTAEAPTPTGYSAAIITTELLPNGVFTKVASLSVVPQTPQTEVQYNTGDLGKSDITKLE